MPGKEELTPVMRLPFHDAFLDVFGAYNTLLWPKRTPALNRGSSAAFALGTRADLALVLAAIVLGLNTVAPSVLGRPVAA